MLLFTNLTVAVLSTPTFYKFRKTADGGCTFDTSQTEPILSGGYTFDTSQTEPILSGGPDEMLHDEPKIFSC